MNNESRPMTEAERDATRRRLRIWQDAQPLLEEQRWRELMNLTDEQALGLTQALFRRPGIRREPRQTSGLVEQQALFARSRDR
jgi:hypothetical protein